MEKHFDNHSKFFIVVVLLFVSFFLFNIFYTLGTVEEGVVFTVTSKERVTQSDGDSVTSKYLIFTEKETFENTDTVLHWKFNSSDIYGSLKEGHKYKATVYGFRIGLTSQYRNIVEIEHLGSAKDEK